MTVSKKSLPNAEPIAKTAKIKIDKIAEENPTPIRLKTTALRAYLHLGGQKQG